MGQFIRVELGLAAAAVAVLLGMSPCPGAAQATGTVQGRVTEATGERPVAGAQVTVVGTQLRAVTGTGGEYTLTNVPAGTRTVRVNLIGYAPAERRVTVAAGQTATVNLEVGQTAVALDALVVTGTAGGTQRRAIGNVVTQINADQVVQTQPINNVQQLINGRAPGVVIMPGTGMVGSGSRIRIRGISSLSLSSEPLLYVDGVRVNNAQGTGPSTQGFGSSVISRINDFNPEDIESIEIIKGPAAATLYGTEAANGVIQIITKKGAQGAPRFNLTVQQGANWFANPEGRLYVNWGPDPRTGEIVSIDMYELEKSGANRVDGRGQDLFRTGHLQEYDLSVSGGSEAVRYYLGGSLERNEGIQPDNRLNQYSGRANVSIAPTRTVDITASVGYVQGRTDLSWEAGAGGISWSTYFASPTRLFNKDGTLNFRRGFWSGTPEVYYQFEDWQDVNRFTGSVQLNHRPTDWLSQRLAVGTDQTRQEDVELIERNDDVARFFRSSALGYRDQVTRGVSYNTLDYSATADLNVTDALSSSTSVGAQFYRRFSEFVSASGEEFPAPRLRAIEAAAIRRGNHDYVENTTVGVFVQQQLGWQNRLFLTAAVRADDNSAFGEDFDLVYYPKVSGTWVLSEEPFWRLPLVETLKLRAAYGESGQQPESFAALRTFAPETGPGDVAVVTPQLVGNPRLGPERGREVELGFDAGFWDDRLGLEFTFYNQRTEDAILLREIAPSTGFSGFQFINIGEIRNTGVEMIARATAVRARTVSWDVSLNLATNSNEVVSLGTAPDGSPLEFVPAGTFQRHQVGFPVASWFEKRLVSAQLDANGKATNLLCDDGQGGTIDCAKAPDVYLGRNTPRYEGAVNTSFTFFENLRLGALIDFKRGYSKLEGDRRVRCWFFSLCRENYFPQEFDPVEIAGIQRRFASDIIKDAGFTKLREVSATYTVPQRWSGSFGASRASITVAGRNLYTWTEYPGLEPEGMFLGVNNRRGSGQGVWEQNVIPQLAQFVASINLSF